MIYSDFQLKHSFNVIYKAEEYDTRFGLLVTAMSDPYDKTILSGMSIRESPIPNKIRVDMGTFDYGKYVVQTNSWIDLDIPDISKRMKPPKKNDNNGGDNDDNDDDNVVDNITIIPAFSFRFLPEEESKDITIVENMYLEYLNEAKVLNNTKYNLRDKHTAITISADTPSIIIQFNKNEILITGYNTVDYSIMDTIIDSAKVENVETIKCGIDDPNYNKNNKLRILLNDNQYKLIKFNVDTNGNLVFLNNNVSDYCFSLENSNKYERIFYRRLLHINEKGLYPSKVINRSVHKSYIHYEPKAKTVDRFPHRDNNGDLIVIKGRNISLISDVEATVNSEPAEYIQQYRWIEFYTHDKIVCTKLTNVDVISYQVYGSIFDESYFGMSFSSDDGVHWLYINTMNDNLVIRTIGFDPVLVTPFSSDLLFKLFNNGLVNKNNDDAVANNPSYYQVIDKDFGYPTYKDYFTNSDDDSYNELYDETYNETLKKINALDNKDYQVKTATSDLFNKILAEESTSKKAGLYKVAITFKYYHDSNIIHFYLKDVTDIDSLDCIVGILVTVDGKNFEVQYRDPVYQRMVPYAEWCDSLPEDIIYNTQLINSRLKDIKNDKVDTNLDLDLSTANSVEDIADLGNDTNRPVSLATYETGLPNVVTGNYNTIYSFSKIKKSLINESIATSITLYASTFIQTQMLLYDYTYSISKLIDPSMIVSDELQTTGLVYNNICLLKENQYINFKLTLPSDTNRFMIIPLTSAQTESNYWLLVNNERFAPFMELSAKNRNVIELNITIQSLLDNMLIYGIGVIYDTDSNDTNRIRLNNRHNLNAPYFDDVDIQYDVLREERIIHTNVVTFDLTYIIHSDLPNDETYIDIYVYDKFIQRFYELSKISERITINTSMIRFDDLYKIKDHYSVPITIKATNKYGSVTTNKELIILGEKIYEIKIRDFKYIYIGSNVNDNNTPDDNSDDIIHDNYLVLISVDTAGRYDVLYEFYFDQTDPHKGIYKGLVTNEIIAISMTIRKDELPRTTYLKVYTINKKFKIDRTLTIE